MTWPPSTARVLEQLCAEDLLSENHSIDFKREVGEAKRARKHLAANMASFATDGGWLVIGFEEQESETPRFRPAPIDLTAQRERLDSIAHTLIDPPLHITVDQLERDTGDGYLLVRIPPSPHVVHAVDGRYHGRRDSQKALLHDAEVHRLLRLRDAHHTSLEQELAEELSHAPSVDESYWTMLVRARPRSAHLWPLRDFLQDGNQQALAREAHQADTAAARAISNVSRQPVTELIQSWWSRRPRGVAATSPNVNRVRQPSPAGHERYLELVVGDDGAVQVWYAERHAHEDERYANLVSDREIVGMTASVIALAGRLGPIAGFDGQWAIGLRVDGTYGLSPRSATGGIVPATSDPYPDPRPYIALSTFETAQAATGLAWLAGDLVMPYLRTVRAEEFYERPPSGE